MSGYLDEESFGRGAANVYLLDAELNLPAGKHSHGLARMTAAAAAAGSLWQACAQVRARTGCPLGTRQAQQLTRAAAAGFEDFYAARGSRAPRPATCWSCPVTGRAS